MNLLKKAVAILASAGMCLTVMTSVFAAGTVSGSDAGVSPSEPSSGGGYVDTTSPVVRPSSPIVTPSEPDEEDPIAIDTLLSGQATPTTVSPVSEPVKDVLEDKTQLAQIVEEAGYAVGDDYDFVVLASGDYSTIDPNHEGKITLGYVIVDKTVEPGDKVYALHQLHNGTWEVIEAVVQDGNVVIVELESLSPVAIVKIMSNGDVVALPKVEVDNSDTEETEKEEKPAEEEKTETTVVNTEKKSPKTGE